MLQVRVFVPQDCVGDVASLLQSVNGTRHVSVCGSTPDGCTTMITADLTPAMTDHVMRRLIDAEVSPEESKSCR